MPLHNFSPLSNVVLNILLNRSRRVLQANDLNTITDTNCNVTRIYVTKSAIITSTRVRSARQVYVLIYK